MPVDRRPAIFDWRRPDHPGDYTTETEAGIQRSSGAVSSTTSTAQYDLAQVNRDHIKLKMAANGLERRFANGVVEEPLF